MSFFGFGQSAEIEIYLDGQESRKTAEVKTEDGKKERLLLYYDGETVAGKVNISLKKPGSKLEHQGIKIEFIGQIEMFYDRGNHHEFISLVKELARPGDMIAHTSYPFEFSCVEKPFEVYTGANVRLRYFLKVTIIRRLADIVKELDIAVHTLSSYPEMNNSIKMEVGIEDCLHIEFEYNKSKYHLKDVIVGKIYFLLVRIKIKHMEIAIIKKETTGTGPNMFTENETIAKYEIMDGAPVRGESIPIRVFLAGYELTPTMRDINKKFSVRYFLNLVLMDTEDRRYFKQQEITLWRKGTTHTSIVHSLILDDCYRGQNAKTQPAESRDFGWNSKLDKHSSAVSSTRGRRQTRTRCEGGLLESPQFPIERQIEF
jgi:vacuolar protein sorting-associated protein 26